MGGFICLVLGLMGKSSSSCPFRNCPCRNLGKRIREKTQASYESAWQKDPELKSFDSSLNLQTSKFITSVAGKNENLSIDSLTHVCGFIKDQNQEVVNTIIGDNEDVWKNEEVKSLVDLHFESTSRTLNFFENCIKKAESRVVDFRVAINIYETESESGGSMTNKYAETLEKLNKVTNMEDPFGEDFAKQYESLRKEHEMILEKIGELQVKFEKKQKNVNTLKKVVQSISLIAFASLLFLSLALPPTHAVVGNVALGLTPSIGPAGIWVRQMMNNRDEALERQIHLLRSMDTKVNIQSMEKIRDLLEKLPSQIKSISQTVETAVHNIEEEAMKMQKIIKEVNEFDEQIKSVREEVASCSKCITEGKSRVQTQMTSPRKW
ncbi:hypothetical protein Bca52824_030175 [Brassica carinata]|uniref:Uncharacterized protein n=1 Tax=Brassica carinata TaxID=52824 RepID=A0A8X7SCQ6_BRACI|nr:hypothetical protein Bca52824_030175 [Brassica carinata]